MSADALKELDELIARRRLHAMRLGTVAIIALALPLSCAAWIREDGGRLALFAVSLVLGSGILLLSRYPGRRVLCAHALLARAR
jgi:hypothetical protein